MPRGHDITPLDRERVWAMVARGCRDLRVIAAHVDLGVVTVREIVYDACGELMRRIRCERQSDRIAELENRADPS